MTPSGDVVGVDVFCSLFLHVVDPGGQLGRRVDLDARAEGLHRVRQRAAPGAAAAAELAAALEPVRVLQPCERTVRLTCPFMTVQSHCGDKTLETRLRFWFLYTAILNGLRHER